MVLSRKTILSLVPLDMSNSPSAVNTHYGAFEHEILDKFDQINPRQPKSKVFTTKLIITAVCVGLVMVCVVSLSAFNEKSPILTFDMSTLKLNENYGLKDSPLPTYAPTVKPLKAAGKIVIQVNNTILTILNI